MCAATTAPPEGAPVPPRRTRRRPLLLLLGSTCVLVIIGVVLRAVRSKHEAASHSQQSLAPAIAAASVKDSVSIASLSQAAQQTPVKPLATSSLLPWANSPSVPPPTNDPSLESESPVEGADKQVAATGPRVPPVQHSGDTCLAGSSGK